MPLIRELWERDQYDIDALPDWPCPHCLRARLQLDGDGLSVRDFRAFRLKCVDCDEIVLVTGSVSDEPSLFQPTCFLPALNIFPLSERCPSNIKTQTRLAFSLYWIDVNAAGNGVRKSIELIMDHLKVRKTTLTKKRKQQPMTLHDRILEYCPKNPDVGDLLLAIKWIGNIGSHGSELQKIDLLEDLEMLEVVHDELFVQSRLRLKRRAILINNSKGLIRR